jgi:hypothetical protein
VLAGDGTGVIDLGGGPLVIEPDLFQQFQNFDVFVAVFEADGTHVTSGTLALSVPPDLWLSDFQVRDDGTSILSMWGDGAMIGELDATGAPMSITQIEADARFGRVAGGTLLAGTSYGPNDFGAGLIPEDSLFVVRLCESP